VRFERIKMWKSLSQIGRWGRSRLRVGERARRMRLSNGIKLTTVSVSSICCRREVVLSDWKMVLRS